MNLDPVSNNSSFECNDYLLCRKKLSDQLKIIVVTGSIDEII